MWPVVNTSITYVPAQALVATTIPGSFATHVPYDNVAPSVSNPQVNNNASGNGGAFSVASETAQIAVADSGTSFPPFNEALTPSPSTPQATFLAQLVSQDDTAETQVILVQYEKLMNLGKVKYKPSDAGLPTPDPAGVFGKLLRQERPSVRQISAPQTNHETEYHSSSAPAHEDAPAPQPAPVATRAPVAANDNRQQVAATAAYTASIARNNAPEQTESEKA